MVENPLLEKYAKLLVEYSLSIERGDRLLIKSTTLAEPLVREVYREALKQGAIVEVDLDFEDQGEILLNTGNPSSAGKSLKWRKSLRNP